MPNEIRARYGDNSKKISGRRLWQIIVSVEKSVIEYSLIILLLNLLSTGSTQAEERVVTKITDGVYVIQHRDVPFEGGNTTVIIGEREVLVVDSCYLPSVARDDLAQLRRWTDKPVRYLLNTHWHNDHNAGNKIYAEAFPGLAIIAQTETKKDMDLNLPKATDRTIRRLNAQKKMLETGLGSDGKVLTEEQKTGIKENIDQLETLANDLKTSAYQAPTLTFDRELNINIGNREVQIKHLGRGNTNGDAIVYLPKEKILITGDLLVSPLPYTYDGYPSEWVTTLEKMAALDAERIVPGHGRVMSDKNYLYSVRDLMKSAVRQMNDKLFEVGPAEFRTLDEVKDGVDLSSFKRRFAGDDKELGEAFDRMTERLVKLVFSESALR